MQILFAFSILIVFAAGCASTADAPPPQEHASKAQKQTLEGDACLHGFSNSDAYEDAPDGRTWSCAASEYATCDADEYRIDCSCPAAACTCLQNGVATQTTAIDAARCDGEANAAVCSGLAAETKGACGFPSL